MKNRKIVISGYKGFIGRNLCAFLKKKKFTIIRYKNASSIKDETNIDCFIHLEFYISNNRDKYLNKNIKKTDEIISFCKLSNTPLIFTSTCFSEKLTNYKINKFNDYQKAKYICEKKIIKSFSKANINYKILRLSNVYGKDLNSRGIIPDLIKRMKNKSIILEYHQNQRDFIFIDDLCSIIFKLIKIKNKLIVNVCFGKSIKISDIANLIKKIFNYDCNIILSNKNISSKNKVSNPNNKKIKKILNINKLVSVKKGLKITKNNSFI